jgi:hypothetical protein
LNRKYEGKNVERENFNDSERNKSTFPSILIVKGDSGAHKTYYESRKNHLYNSNYPHNKPSAIERSNFSPNNPLTPVKHYQGIHGNYYERGKDLEVM